MPVAESPFSLESPERALEEILVPQLPAPVAGALAPSPYNFEFTGEDAIRLTVHNSQSGVRVAVHWRLLDRQRKIQANRHELTPASDRSASSVEFSIGEGYLLNMTCFAASGSPRRGQTFARVQVIRGRDAAAVVLGTAIQGYVTGNQDRAWPGSPIEGSLESDGHSRHITGTDPAAGAGISEAVPTGARWAVRSVRARFVTDATVGGRSVFLQLVAPAGNIAAWSWQSMTQTASLTVDHHWSRDVQQQTAPTPSQQASAMPNMVLLAGGTVVAGALGAVAGDNWGAPELAVDEWLEAN